ncbi:MAG: hypothetical protein IKW58_00085 [Alphaproteobacteria bacterium]|nr:hypothetical protein [Alphaproteobacteria bacterium]
MIDLGIKPQKIISYSKSLMFPAIILGFICVYFFSMQTFDEHLYNTFHTLFICTILISVVFSARMRIISSFICSSIIYISYILINSSRYAYGEDYIFSGSYNIWTMFVIPNMLLTNILLKITKVRKKWNLLFILILLETAIVEKIQNQTVEADSTFFYKHIASLNYPAFYISLICILALFINYIAKGRILTAKTLFSSISLLFAMMYSDNLLAYSLFFFTAILIECIMTMYYTYYIRYKDEDINIPNYNLFILDAEKKYLPKYSISLLCIDEYGRLLKRFGKHKTLLLKKMFIKQILKVNPSVKIYNYQDDVLILVFTNINTLACFDKAEEIRRSIATSIFIFNETNHLQLTISQCVGEIKRSDAGPQVLVNRVETELQKVCKFTRNITVKS